MRPSGAGRARGGYTLMELTAAIAVVGLAMTMLVALMVAARRTARLQSERRLAGALAQGALERLRGAAPGGLPGKAGKKQPLPPEAGRLRNARILASAAPWKGQKGLRRVKVTISWDSRAGQRRRLVREGLVSDARAR